MHPRRLRAGSAGIGRAAAGEGRGGVEGADVGRQHRSAEADRGGRTGDERVGGMTGASAAGRGRRAARARPAVPQRSVRLLHGRPVHRPAPRRDAALRRRGALQYIDEYGVDSHAARPDDDDAHAEAPRGGAHALPSSLAGILHLAAPCPPHVKEGWIDWIGAEKVWELYAGTEAQGVTIISGTDWLAHRGHDRQARAPGR